MSLILLLAALLIAGGSLLVARAMQAQSQSAQVEQRLQQFAVVRKHRRPEPEVTADVESVGIWRWLEPTGKERIKLIAQLQEADFSRVNALHRFALLRLLTSVAVTVSTYVWASSGAGLPVMIQITLTVLGFTIAYVGAGQWLTIMANSRKNRVRQEFAFVLDLFVLTVEAGLSLDQSIRHVARHAGRAAPLTQAGLIDLVHDIDTGMTYDAALTRWSRRLGVDEARELAGMFRQSLIHGAPLGDTLRGYSSDLRERRMTEAREVAGKISVRMTLVMVLCFLPALMILIGGPAVNAIIGGLTGMPDANVPPQLGP